MSEKNDKVLLEFPVMWVGWECDSKAWVMERPDGTRYIRMTNHGSPYKANPAELRERISEYESVLEQTRNALELLALSSEAAVKILMNKEHTRQITNAFKAFKSLSNT